MISDQEMFQLTEKAKDLLGETWRVDASHPWLIEFKSGCDIGGFRRFAGDDENFNARAKLAAQTPAMARTLVALLEMYDSKWPSPKRLGEIVAQARTVLREAGVIP